MHRVAHIVVGLEALAIGVYFVSVHVADSFLPERGGSGDATSIYLWNGRAALAFWLLVALWLVALGRVALRALRISGSVAAVTWMPPRGVDALAVALPILGVLVGYAGLLVLD
jgi:hypothetical protein